MKRAKKKHDLLYAFLLYFVLCAFVVTCSFLLFFQNIRLPEEQIPAAARATFYNIIFLTFLFAAIDMGQRRITVDKPVEKIQSALSRITGGDFSVRLDAKGSPASFAEIMNSINRMTEELSGVETLRTDFISNVSHELKTPLAVMQNYGTMLQQPGLSEDQRVEYARAVTDASRRLADLITNILRLNKLENQQIFPSTEEYDLSEQLCECLLQFEPVWEQKQIEPEVDIAAGIRIRADAELLSLVWNNLFSNAFKFTGEGGSVSVRLTADTETASITVRDTGCGIKPEVGTHIFEKFYQGDASRTTQGNGLGLALVKRVIDIIHGEIHVESVYGEGSTFTVTIRKNQDEKLEAGL